MTRIEYRVRPVTRYIITRYEEAVNTTGSETRSEYDNAETAYAVATALAKADHDRLGYPPGDERIVYPEPIGQAGAILPGVDRFPLERHPRCAGVASGLGAGALGPRAGTIQGGLSGRAIKGDLHNT